MKRLFLCTTLVAVLLLGASPVLAQAAVVYVDPDYDGNESGTQEKPYDTEAEARAYLQSLPNGGYLYIRKADGTWSEPEYVPPAKSGTSGVPLPQVILYAMLGLLALVLIVVGWRLLKRACQV